MKCWAIMPMSRSWMHFSKNKFLNNNRLYLLINFIDSLSELLSNQDLRADLAMRPAKRGIRMEPLSPALARLHLGHQQLTLPAISLQDCSYLAGFSQLSLSAGHELHCEWSRRVSGQPSTIHREQH